MSRADVRSAPVGVARLRERVRFARGGIVANRMRWALTMPGIVIGVASVITSAAVGTGSNRAVAAASI
ncbi:MAG TPA: hypothetical protein VHV82_13560 [Sporichthyaceae bacterium]|jgi:macrolide transport system ATP-binding/permease protein|nr:hypothetical protein [Sporichthyaceae bacterium]